MFYLYILLKVCFIAKVDNSNSRFFLAKADNSTFQVSDLQNYS